MSHIVTPEADFLHTGNTITLFYNVNINFNTKGTVTKDSETH